MEHQPPLQSMVSSSNNNSKNNHGSNHSNGKSAILSWTKNNNNHRPKKMTSPVRSQQPLPPCADTGKGKITLDRLSKAPLRALQYLMIMESNGNAHSPTSTIPVTSLGKGFGRGLPNILSPPSHSPRHVGATSSSGYPRKSRDPVRRCVSDDLDRPRAASGGGVLPGKNGTGLFSGKGSGWSRGENRADDAKSQSGRGHRPRSQGASIRQWQGFGQTPYRLSIELEKDENWLLPRRSAELAQPVSRANSSLQSSEGGVSPCQRRHTDVSDANQSLLVNGSLGDTSSYHDNAGVNGAHLLHYFFVLTHLSVAAAVALCLFLRGVTAGVIGGACLVIFLSMVLFFLATGRIYRALLQYHHRLDDGPDGDRLFDDDDVDAEAYADAGVEDQGGYSNRPRCADSSDASDDAHAGRPAGRREGGTERRGERDRLVLPQKVEHDAEEGRGLSYGAVRA